MIKQLTKVDVTRYPACGPQVTCLLNAGFRMKSDGRRILMTKETTKMRDRVYRFFRGRQTDEQWQETCEVFLAGCVAVAILTCFFVLSGL